MTDAQHDTYSAVGDMEEGTAEGDIAEEDVPRALEDVLEVFIGGPRTEQQLKLSRAVDQVLGLRERIDLTPAWHFKLRLLYAKARSIFWYRRRLSTVISDHYDRVDAECSEVETALEMPQKVNTTVIQTIVNNRAGEYVEEETIDRTVQVLQTFIQEIIVTRRQTLEALYNRRQAIIESWGMLYPGKPFPREIPTE